MFDDNEYFKIIHNSTKFKKNTVLKFITCSDYGKCYLMADLYDDLNREWIMYYDLEEMI